MSHSSAGRLGAAAMGTALTGAAFWLAWINLGRDGLESWIFWLPVAGWLLAMALLCLWRGLGDDTPESRARIGASWRAGWIVAGVGLALGFVGPLLLQPGANLGPLLGLLITGPGGFVLGALGGAVAGVAGRRGGP